MARRRSRSRRDHSAIANLRLLAPSPVVRLSPLTHSRSLLVHEDRRTFHPTRFARTAFSLPRSAARVVMAPRQKFRGTKATLTFEAPKRVALCVRRERRREVLFAHGVGGSRARKRRPRRGPFSDVSCR